MPNGELLRAVAQRPTVDLNADALVAEFVRQLKHRYGKDLRAVVMYGSYLRGKRDTVLDFYAILDAYHPAMSRLSAWANRALPPNVYTLTATHAGVQMRAKFATVTLRQFRHTMCNRLDCYFWARFTQPCAYVHVADAATEAALTSALAQAAETFAHAVVPVLPHHFNAADFWGQGLALTYATELRAEAPAAAQDLYTVNAAYLDRVLFALAPALGMQSVAPGLFAHDQGRHAARARHIWRARRWVGKSLSVARLIKAAWTFNDGFAYLLWKIERHSGIYIEPTPRQARYPLIFAWPLLWRLYRRGAFR